MENSPKNFGERLAALRKAAGYVSPEAFARAAGVAKQTVYNWEARIDPPPPSKVQKIATALGLTPAQVRGHEPIRPHSDAVEEPPPNVYGCGGEEPKSTIGLTVLASPTDLADESRAICEHLISLAGKRVSRHYWLQEQLRTIVPPRHWVDEDKHAARVDRMFEDMRPAAPPLDEETGA